MALAISTLTRSAIIGIAIATVSAPVAGQNARQLWPDTLHALKLDYRKRAKALQQEFSALKWADGGQLTAEHLALLQSKLGDLLASYERELDRIDPMRINADGTRPR